MSNWVGVLIALAILTLAGALALPSLEEAGQPVGRYQLQQGSGGSTYRIDTTTGDTWVSVGGGDWHLIGEEDEEKNEEAARISASNVLPDVSVSRARTCAKHALTHSKAPRTIRTDLRAARTAEEIQIFP